MKQPELTTLLNGLSPDDPRGAEKLLPLVYEELREMAAAKMNREAPGQTLQPTALVHEAWLRLGNNDQRQWNGRGHFMAAAAEAMRRILIDRARRKGRVRRGGGLERVALDAVDIAATTDDETLLEISEALDKLAEVAPEKAQLVKLRYFTGLSIVEAAEVLGIAPATAKRHWAFARAWLYAELTAGR